MEPTETDFVRSLIERTQVAELLEVVVHAESPEEPDRRRALRRSIDELQAAGKLSDFELDLLRALARPGTTYAEAGEAIGRYGPFIVRAYGEIVGKLTAQLAVSGKPSDDWAVPEFRPVTDD